MVLGLTLSWVKFRLFVFSVKNNNRGFGYKVYDLELKGKGYHGYQDLSGYMADCFRRNMKSFVIIVFKT